MAWLPIVLPEVKLKNFRRCSLFLGRSRLDKMIFHRVPGTLPPRSTLAAGVKGGTVVGEWAALVPKESEEEQLNKDEKRRKRKRVAGKERGRERERRERERNFPCCCFLFSKYAIDAYPSKLDVHACVRSFSLLLWFLPFGAYFWPYFPERVNLPVFGSTRNTCREKSSLTAF